MIRSQEWEKWQWDYNNAFREVEFNILGKNFISYIRIKPDKKTWVMLYQNEDNPNDWFIREEVISPDVWYYGKPILPQAYNYLLSKLIEKG